MQQHTQLSAAAAAKWTVAFCVAQWSHMQGTLQLLIMLMCLDYVTGLSAAYIQHQVSSDHGWRGILRKLMTLGILLLGHMLEGSMQIEIGIERIGAIAYSVNEAISIVENCARAGVPIPAPLVAALQTAKTLKVQNATPQQVAELEKPDAKVS